jgi:hypothetical protein
MVAVALAVAPGRTALAAAPLEQFTAFAVDMSNIAGRTRTGTIDILIDRWSTDAERDTLVSALREGGSDGLLRALQKIKKPAGSIRSAGSVGYRLQFARQVTRDDGGRRILIATDRPISFLEAVNQPRTTDYPFMILDIRLNAKQEGEGKLIPLAKIEMNGDHVVEIENYASEPVRLNQVKKLK